MAAAAALLSSLCSAQIRMPEADALIAWPDKFATPPNTYICDGCKGKLFVNGAESAVNEEGVHREPVTMSWSGPGVKVEPIYFDTSGDLHGDCDEDDSTEPATCGPLYPCGSVLTFHFMVVWDYNPGGAAPALSWMGETGTAEGGVHYSSIFNNWSAYYTLEIVLAAQCDDEEEWDPGDEVPSLGQPTIGGVPVGPLQSFELRLECSKCEYQ